MKINRYCLRLHLNAAHDRNIQILLASPENLEAIDRVLEGRSVPPRPERRGPFLLKMGAASMLLSITPSMAVS